VLASVVGWLGSCAVAAAAWPVVAVAATALLLLVGRALGECGSAQGVLLEAIQRAAPAAPEAAVEENGNGHGNGHRNGNGNGHDVANGNGNGNGRG
jgi:hypothetical protein